MQQSFPGPNLLDRIAPDGRVGPNSRMAAIRLPLSVCVRSRSVADKASNEIAILSRSGNGVTTHTIITRVAPILIATSLPFLASSCVTDPILSAQHKAQKNITQRSSAAIDQRESTRAADGTKFLVGVPDPDRLDAMKLQKDQNKTVAEGAGIGSLIAGGIGCALGVSGNAAIAGVHIGTAYGNQWGQHVAMKKALAQTSEANFDACIKESFADNAAARKRVSFLQAHLADYKKRIKAAQAEGNTREFAKIKKDLGKLGKQVCSEVASYDKGIGMQKQVITKVDPANAKYAKLNSAVRANIESRNALEAQRKLIVSLLNSL